MKAAQFPWSTLSSPTAPFYSLSDRTALSSSIPTAKGRRSKPAKQMGMGRWLKASISPTRSQQPHQQNVMGGLRQYGEESRTGGLSLPLFSLRGKWSCSVFGYQNTKNGVEINVCGLVTAVPLDFKEFGGPFWRISSHS